MSYLDHDYTDIMKSAKIISLEKARFKNDMLCMYKLNNGLINCSHLSSQLNENKIYNPSRQVKIHNIFEIDHMKLNYSIIQRNCHLMNLNKNWLSMNDITLYQFQNLIFKNLDRITMNC